SEITRSDEEIAAKLAEKSKVPNVEASCLAAAAPSFDEGFQAAITSRTYKTFVVTSSRSTSLMMKSLQKKINALSSDDQQIILCGYLGDHPSMVDALAERTQEALQSEQQLAW